MNRHKFHDVACQGNLKFCQGNVREFCFRWSVATLIIILSFVVAICDLAHAVEAMYGLP